ncbi:MAG TPA: nitroreductase family protein [Acidimicrobiales bacterium]|jgi:nitroreductase
MELHEAINRRRMVRSFSTEPVDRTVLDRILQAALQAPTAGNTGGTAWVVLNGPEETARYWDATADAQWREHYSRFDGLSRAPVILLAYSSAQAYVERYAEPDKAAAGLGQNAADWPVPYWTGDAAFGVLTVLLAVVDAGLGATIAGTYREAEVAAALGVPDEWRLFCAVVLGHPDGNDHRSPSLDRPRPQAPDRIRWGRW